MKKITNKYLKAANKNKNDEFYTQLYDIENELKHYSQHLKNKIILCNCDNYESNFIRYFRENFKKLKLKKLITSCYYDQTLKLFSDEKPRPAIYTEYDGITTIQRKLRGDGDFRSLECIDILKSADIIVTNPPFSLFRDFVAQLVKYDKQFILLGNQNAISYAAIFKLILSRKIWLGKSLHGTDVNFYVPDTFTPTGNYTIDENNKMLVRIPGIRWFTNIRYPITYKDLPLTKKYNKEDYPKYDHYDAININKTLDIPKDYKQKMGVPITFLDKFNPQQFKLVDAIGHSSLIDGVTPETKGKYLAQINGKPIYTRIIIKSKQ